MDDPMADAYAEASDFLVAVVRAVPDDAWEAAGLGEWTVRELVGHANRAHVLVRAYVLDPQPTEAPDSPYWTPEAIAARGREAVATLGADPVAAVVAAAAATRELIVTSPPDTPLGSPAGMMPMRDYLASRVAELVIHGLDLVEALVAAGVPREELPEPTAGALEAALDFVAGRAAHRRGVEVLRALTGRGDLPDGYSVY